MLCILVVKHIYISFKEINYMIKGVLTIKERAYIIDKIGGTTYYNDEFGSIDSKTEEKIIASIFKKLELTYYIPAEPELSKDR